MTKAERRAPKRYRNALFVYHRKAKRGCQVCGSRDLFRLTFHHRQPEQKAFTISDLLTRGSSLPLLASEMNKCDVLCEACHRRLHGTDAKGEISSSYRPCASVVVAWKALGVR